MEDTKETLGQQLTAAWQAAGAPPYRALERELVKRLGDTSVSNTTIADYHKGKVTPERANPAVVGWLAQRYGVPLETLSPTVAIRAIFSRDILNELDLTEAERSLIRSRWLEASQPSLDLEFAA
jgi:transcriptional regulator with XRE-family HTH domain